VNVWPAWDSRRAADGLRSGHVQVVRLCLQQPAALRWDWLSPDERHRAQRYVREDAARTFAGFRAQVRRVLGALLQRSPESLEFEYGSAQKPHLRDGSLEFNLSHSGELALLAVAGADPVGIDIERVVESTDLLSIAQRVFLPDERAIICGETGEPSACRFFEQWTLKEALLKATGTGFQIDPASISIGRRRVVTLGGLVWRLELLPVGHPWTAAIAFRGGNIDLWELDGTFGGVNMS
jgi:4'-phosphopantetheinyl transferase